jgi:hypothetical protein
MPGSGTSETAIKATLGIVHAFLKRLVRSNPSNGSESGRGRGRGRRCRSRKMPYIRAVGNCSG